MCRRCPSCSPERTGPRGKIYPPLYPPHVPSVVFAGVRLSPRVDMVGVDLCVTLRVADDAGATFKFPSRNLSTFPSPPPPRGESRATSKGTGSQGRSGGRGRGSSLRVKIIGVAQGTLVSRVRGGEFFENLKIVRDAACFTGCVGVSRHVRQPQRDATGGHHG